MKFCGDLFFWQLQIRQARIPEIAFEAVCDKTKVYPTTFASDDQFAVKALRGVPGLPEAEKLLRMNPEGLTIRDGKLLIHIMTEKAQTNNALFDVTDWTRRKVDKVLWTYCRD